MSQASLTASLSHPAPHKCPSNGPGLIGLNACAVTVASPLLSVGTFLKLCMCVCVLGVSLVTLWL